MRVLVGIPDLFVLAGNVRVSLELADMMKELGHKVVILYSNIRGESQQYFKLDEIGSYYPIRNLDFSDFEKVSWVNYYIEILARFGLYEPEPHYDIFLTNYDPLAYVNEDVDFREIFYVNWPDRPGTPSCEVWANSKYTQRRVLNRWGISSTVVNPPIKIEIYNSSLSFKERDIDVIGFGQLYPMKRFQSLSPLHDRGYKTYVIGADVKQGRPDVTKVVASPNFDEVTRFLSRSKVFVHSKTGEHFGIAVIEAMASGCATICHRSGGPLSDIILDEKYGLLFSTRDELVEKVDYLLSDENIWKRYSDLAVERAKEFSYSKIKNQVSELLNKQVSKPFFGKSFSSKSKPFSLLDHDMVEALVVNFSEEGDTILNPFLSWGMVAEVARELDRNSISFDIVPEYCEMARKKINKIEQTEPKAVETIIRCCDSRNMPLPDESVDLILGSPPYWCLEKYKSVSGQLSDVADYGAFLWELKGIVLECYRVLRNGKYCLWVVGDFREGNEVYDFREDTVKLFEKNGFMFVTDPDKRRVADIYDIREGNLFVRQVLAFVKTWRYEI